LNLFRTLLAEHSRLTLFWMIAGLALAAPWLVSVIAW
jgi:hypothetical protein